ncbi:hypothetical protein SAPIO_CDS9305 [Scedosporium apiospermum]|uniref:Uncharacterized protein n=1 Tax=Pseudallescheria apiosperma TaxID=563466 RepID=A0A084FXL4_PSEDA|nr:uncharacterized protein SAPIO_CDS9305 [Scedosporium apiospermum]KEZ39826.1 hypothetical protein SAPIO_CDS9305 [Scedosporium apiospermum]
MDEISEAARQISLALRDREVLLNIQLVTSTTCPRIYAVALHRSLPKSRRESLPKPPNLVVSHQRSATTTGQNGWRTASATFATTD